MESPEPASPPVEAGDAVRVIRIMPQSSYAIVVPDDWEMERLEALVRAINEWGHSGAQFVLLQGVKLVRLNGEAPEEGTSDPDGGN